ncbi:dioxygenase [Sinorhizobium meliloti]|uniref:dioxygenase n=1 Tax=Rhizobium meliloti TaxID=382 RepID=UPI003F5CCCB2
MEIGHGKGKRSPLPCLTDIRGGTTFAKKLFIRVFLDLSGELCPSRAEWRAFLNLLIDIGDYSDTRRDEWALISVLFGISALVEELNHHRPPAATPNTARGPFYRDDTPERPLGANMSLDTEGEPMSVSGKVPDPGRAAGRRCACDDLPSQWPRFL